MNIGSSNKVEHALFRNVNLFRAFIGSLQKIEGMKSLGNGVSVSDSFLKSPSPLVKEFHAGVARSEYVSDGFLKSPSSLVKEFHAGVARWKSVSEGFLKSSFPSVKERVARLEEYV
ncbi:hypothetical protein TSUD_52220 [Trifolium subterraneum]|uniref:Uncharacterized protein n=1 Tax=Trifolium subterraneum TaxID=3900 RepID=A0A2Z6P7I5_TRISU|nr:hypothetical protein TSUD_52220 [Trifolium subterraneum]